jgi:hypothetical protein
MKTNTLTVKLFIITALLLAGALGFTGCADYASVGVGYGDAYYVPDYSPLYAGYFYDGVPYWGPNVDYIRNKLVVKDVDKHVDVNRNIYYGGHHFVRDWHGPRPIARAASFRRDRR